MIAGFIGWTASARTAGLSGRPRCSASHPLAPSARRKVWSRRPAGPGFAGESGDTGIMVTLPWVTCLSVASSRKRAAVAERGRLLERVGDAQYRRFLERFADQLDRHRQPLGTKTRAHRHRRVAGDVERHHEARLLKHVPFRHIGDLWSFAG